VTEKLALLCATAATKAARRVFFYFAVLRTRAVFLIDRRPHRFCPPHLPPFEFAAAVYV